jgi:hypothetical protein
MSLPADLEDPCDWRGVRGARDAKRAELDGHVRKLHGALLHGNAELVHALAGKIIETATQIRDAYGTAPAAGADIPPPASYQMRTGTI